MQMAIFTRAEFDNEQPRIVGRPQKPHGFDGNTGKRAEAFAGGEGALVPQQRERYASVAVEIARCRADGADEGGDSRVLEHAGDHRGGGRLTGRAGYTDDQRLVLSNDELG